MAGRIFITYDAVDFDGARFKVYAWEDDDPVEVLWEFMTEWDRVFGDQSAKAHGYNSYKDYIIFQEVHRQYI